MSDRPIDIDLTKSTEVRVDQVPTPEEIREFRGRIAQVFDRTLTVDRTEVNLPSNLTGYWCSDDPVSIAQAELRGFRMDLEFASRNGLTDAADGRAHIGDVVHMIRPKWMKDEEESLRSERYRRTHLIDRRKQKEEKDFLANNELPPIVSSKSDDVSGVEIEESLTKR